MSWASLLLNIAMLILFFIQHSTKGYFSSGTPLTSPLSTHHDKGSFIMYPPLRQGNVSWPPSEFADSKFE